MFFATYPNSEVVTPYTYLYYLNGSFNGPYYYASEANVIQNSAMYASNSTLVPDAPAMRQDMKNTQDNRYFNVQSGDLQQASWSNRGQFETRQGFDQYFDASSHARINSRISDCHDGLDKYSKTSSRSGIKYTSADCHGGPVSVVDSYSQTSSQASFNSIIADCQEGLVSVLDNCFGTSSQAAINFTNVDCHGETVSAVDNYFQTSFQASFNSRTSDCQGARVNNSKGSEIWRPFCPSPTKEVSVDGSDRNKQNIPSRTKLEHSKTSLFKPVKKRDYKCRYCASSFASSPQLNSHLRVHTGSKPFHCPACRKRFARNEELTRHLRIHSGYKPHACRMCGKSFGRKDHLAKHSKTHLRAEEKRAYACPLPGCGHRYTRSDALTRHRRTSAHATYRREGELTVELKKDILIS